MMCALCNVQPARVGAYCSTTCGYAAVFGGSVKAARKRDMEARREARR
jgi:hypothetical protein